MDRTISGILAIVTIILCSCSTSSVYDPTLRMPARQLQTSEVQGTAGWGMLPESRPAAVNDKLSQHALFVDGRAGLSKRVTLQARTWMGVADTVTEEAVRWGVGGSILYAIDTGSIGWRSGFLLSAGLGFQSNAIEGLGGAFNYVMYTPKWLDMQPYFSVGGVLACSNDSISDWGIAPLLHAGVSWEFVDNVGLTAEVTSIFQINVAENVYHTILTPTVSLYVRL